MLLFIMRQFVDEESGEWRAAERLTELTHVILTGETKVSRKCELEAINYTEQVKNDCH